MDHAGGFPDPSLLAQRIAHTGRPLVAASNYGLAR